MKTRCPTCATTFRVVPVQLRARAGRVRCGECGALFNALDTLLDETIVLAPPPDAAPATPAAESEARVFALHTATATDEDPGFPTSWLSGDASADPAFTLATGAGDTRDDLPNISDFAIDEEIARADEGPAAPPAEDRAALLPEDAASTSNAESGESGDALPDPVIDLPAARMGADGSDAAPAAATSAANIPVTSSFASLLQPPADGGVLPRQMTEIPGYSKWGEGVIAAPAASVEPESPRAPFVAVAAILALLLVGQGVFALRSEIAAALPSLRPALESFAGLFGSELPPLRRAELISIEGSDLQSDPARGGRLLLLATLANHAPYPQALPLIELTLTDTHDQVVARKVFPAEQYLPDPALAAEPFAARGEIALRLWIETRELDAAGYRLYVFYP